MASASVNTSNESLRVIFAGTPDFSSIHLNALIDSKHQLLAVYSQPDRPAGRGKKLRASPVKQLAEAAGISVYQPASLRVEEEQHTLANLNADVMVVVAYGLILPQAVLDAPRLGCLNVHASLLPRWRGAAPIQRAIEAGDSETGITIMQMDAGLDTGAMLATANCAIGPQTSSALLHDSLADLGPPLLLQVLDNLVQFQGRAVSQNEELVTYAEKILKPEAELNWRQEAAVLARMVRAFNPFPVCFGSLGQERVKIWEAQPVNITASEAPGTIMRADKEGIMVSCGGGQLLIQRLQLAGGKPLTAMQLLNARSELFAPGNRFTLPATGAD
jgi:methionyl-tRNA formyltransferase